MKILAGVIRRQLQLETNDFGHCAIYEQDLQRIWPITEENRKAKIADFAEKHGFRLIYYKQGLCAIFVEDSAVKSRETRGGARAAK
ncbi:MAG TPA: hypothetical protein VFQ78_10910 [Candidatus Udaeobacter sp.]|jgi:hypothetical protein|nr:hypothetical protein [Candidatus Udaeobacter sp.]